MLAREDHAKEVKLFSSAPRLWIAIASIFKRIYDEEKRLTIRRNGWGFALGLVSSAAFYGAYAWIAFETVAAAISLGEMTMYLLLFKQGQSAVAAMLSAIGGMYEDNLYLSNLYDYLEQPSGGVNGAATRRRRPAAGIEFDHVRFTYPGATAARDRDLTLAIKPGQSVALVGLNGSGKTTLVKLLADSMCRRGRDPLQGRDLREWDPVALRRKIGVIFQDFNRYQLTVGENIGAGDATAFDDRARWSDAAAKGQASGLHLEPAGGVRDAARPLVQQRPGALGRPVAADRARARLHAQRRRDPRARRADGRDGRRDRGASVRPLPLAHREQDRRS